MKETKTAIAATVLAVLFLGLVYFVKNTAVQKSNQKVLGSNFVQTQNLQASQSANPKESTPHAKSIISNEPATLASGYCLNVPVLMYHHIQPNEQAKAEGHAFLNVDASVFDSQMAYLSQRGYNSITADQLAQALKNKSSLPPKSIVLTFDDGYSDFYTYAFPAVNKYNLKANLMVPTGLVENSGYMTWGQLKEISSSGAGFIYNHTWSHANLGNAPLEKIDYEISTSQKQLSAYMGQNPDVFTYPYGSMGATLTSYLAKNGFIAAFSEIPGTYQCDSFLLSLHRTRVGNSQLSAYGI